jgi:hypothetical protein
MGSQDTLENHKFLVWGFTNSLATWEGLFKRNIGPNFVSYMWSRSGISGIYLSFVVIVDSGCGSQAN